MITNIFLLPPERTPAAKWPFSSFRNSISAFFPTARFKTSAAFFA
jgi:hypothetical protein